MGIDNDEFARLCKFELSIDRIYGQRVGESIIDSFRLRLPVAKADGATVAHVDRPISAKESELPEDYSPPT
ncbi:MAG: hypothetical protein Q7V63_02305 [Gammaproteobacteria bacterium]|nr:hypothetical protein [Gammaproteobacteria bacterium]